MTILAQTVQLGFKVAIAGAAVAEAALVVLRAMLADIGWRSFNLGLFTTPVLINAWL
jgi:hypothetical protein